MRNLKKITAFLLAVVIAVCMGACARSSVATANKEWGYRANNKEYAVGTYLLPMMDAYKSMYAYMYYNDVNFDSEASLMDAESSFDESGELYTGREWIVKQSDDYVKYMVAVDYLMDKYGVTLADEVVDSAYSQAETEWYLGDYEAAMSGYSESVPVKDLYEPCGISLDSYFEAAYMMDIKYDAIFTRLYSRDGEKAVAQEEIEEYYENNYTKYSYCIVDLYVSVVDEVTSETVNTPYDEAATADIKRELESYTKRLNNGDSLAKIEADLKEFANVDDQEIFIEKTETYESVSSSISEEVSDALKNLKDGEATVLYMGQENTPIAIFVYKHPINKTTEEYLKDDINYRNIVAELKGQEFFDYLADIAVDVEYEMNTEVLKRFTPEFIEKKYKAYLQLVS